MVRLSQYKARAARAARYMAYMNGRGPQYKLATDGFRMSFRAPLRDVVVVAVPLVMEEPITRVGAAEYVLLRGRNTRAPIS